MSASLPARFDDTAVTRIESLTHEGWGVGRIDGKAVFIEGALPGEEVRFRYLTRRKTYDTGRLVEIITPSPDRRVPPCPHFGVCGGCSLQHLAPAAQLLAKQTILLETLARIGKLAPDEVFAPIAGPAWHYRRKARLGVRVVEKKGGVIVGFRERRHSFITPLASCETLEARVGALLPALRELITGLSRPDRLPQIEVAGGDSELALVFRHLEPLTDADIARLRSFGEAHRVQIHLQPKGPDSIHLLWPEAAAPLHYDLPAFDVRLEFGPSDFTQVNAATNRALVERAVNLLDPQAHERVLDLFCGLGNFSLPLARRAAYVLAVEGDAALVEKGQRNAALNDIRNVEFAQADLYSEAAPFPWDYRQFDKLLLDPPRSGAMQAVKALPADGPRRIVYISCFPATLARDGEYLVHVLGYRLLGAGVTDMFPQTSHVESIALFERPA